MVVAKNKLAHSPKKAVTIAPPPAEPTPVVAPVAPTAPSKWPCPDVETTGNVAQPKKHIKKKAKMGAREIHVISSQTTGAITPSTHIPFLVVQASTEVPQNPLIGQATEV